MGGELETTIDPGHPILDLIHIVFGDHRGEILQDHAIIPEIRLD